MSIIKVGLIYRHKKSGRLYLTSGLTKSLTQVNNVWIPEVRYILLNPTTPEERELSFSRSLDNFKDSFEVIPLCGGPKELKELLKDLVGRFILIKRDKGESVRRINSIKIQDELVMLVFNGRFDPNIAVDHKNILIPNIVL